MKKTGYTVLSIIVLTLGINQGVIPLIKRLFASDTSPGLSLALRLPAPYGWLAAVVVIVVTLVLLEMLDRAKKRLPPN